MLEYINNPNVVIINVLSDDANAMWTCEEWGTHGIDGFPIIIDDYNDNTWSHTIGDWFGISWSSPWHIFLDHNYIYYGKTQDLHEVDSVMEQMLENLE
mgnify:FL=1